MIVGDEALITSPKHPWKHSIVVLRAFDPKFQAWRGELYHGGSCYVKENEMKKVSDL
jgi:hypothetical protein